MESYIAMKQDRMAICQKAAQMMQIDQKVVMPNGQLLQLHDAYLFPFMAVLMRNVIANDPFLLDEMLASDGRLNDETKRKMHNVMYELLNGQDQPDPEQGERIVAFAHSLIVTGKGVVKKADDVIAVTNRLLQQSLLAKKNTLSDGTQVVTYDGYAVEPTSTTVDVNEQTIYLTLANALLVANDPDVLRALENMGGESLESNPMIAVDASQLIAQTWGKTLTENYNEIASDDDHLLDTKAYVKVQGFKKDNVVKIVRDVALISDHSGKFNKLFDSAKSLSEAVNNLRQNMTQMALDHAQKEAEAAEQREKEEMKRNDNREERTERMLTKVAGTVCFSVVGGILAMMGISPLASAWRRLCQRRNESPSIDQYPSPAQRSWSPPLFTMYYRLLRGKHQLFVGFEDTDGKWKQVNPNLDFKEMKVFKKKPGNKDGGEGEQTIINNDTRYEQFVAAKRILYEKLPR